MIVEEYNRRSIRLKGFDYCSERYYFVTIVSKARENIFGKIVGARRDAPKIKLNKNGRIIREIWYTLPEHHEIELDEFVIMPNHVHMILKIVKSGISLDG